MVPSGFNQPRSFSEPPARTRSWFQHRWLAGILIKKPHQLFSCKKIAYNLICSGDSVTSFLKTKLFQTCFLSRVSIKANQQQQKKSVVGLGFRMWFTRRLVFFLDRPCSIAQLQFPSARCGFFLFWDLQSRIQGHAHGERENRKLPRKERRRLLCHSSV